MGARMEIISRSAEIERQRHLQKISISGTNIYLDVARRSKTILSPIYPFLYMFKEQRDQRPAKVATEIH